SGCGKALRRSCRKRPPLRDDRVRRPAAIDARRPGKGSGQGTRKVSGQGSGEELREEPGLCAASRDRPGAGAECKAGQASPQLLLKTLVEARGARTGASGAAGSAGQAGDSVSGIDAVVVLQALTYLAAVPWRNG